jgi:hypothetical protein
VRVGVILKIPEEFVIPKARHYRAEESAASLPAASRFLADRPGFGMTRVGLFLRKLHLYPILPNLVI